MGMKVLKFKIVLPTDAQISSHEYSNIGIDSVYLSPIIWMEGSVHNLFGIHEKEIETVADFFEKVPVSPDAQALSEFKFKQLFLDDKCEYDKCVSIKGEAKIIRTICKLRYNQGKPIEIQGTFIDISDMDMAKRFGVYLEFFGENIITYKKLVQFADKRKIGPLIVRFLDYFLSLKVDHKELP